MHTIIITIKLLITTTATIIIKISRVSRPIKETVTYIAYYTCYFNLIFSTFSAPKHVVNVFLELM